MRAILSAGVVLGLVLVADFAEAAVDSERVASGLSQPIFATHAPGDPGRLYILERGGDIEVLDLATGAVSTFLDLPAGVVNAAGEGGLLGLAFDPGYEDNGRFYLNLTTGNDNTNLGPYTFRTEIRRYQRLNPNAADPNSGVTLLSHSQPQTNHNGGWIGFNPKTTPDTPQYLYIASGDGGGSDDNDTGHTAGTGNAQDTTGNLLGKILRIDVSAGGSTYAVPASNPFVGETGDDEILAHGLRNPFRAGFDRLTGELYIGDVGQGAREEIDRIPAPLTSPTAEEPKRNFGWRLREGNIQTPSVGVGGLIPADYVAPIYDYRRTSDNDPNYPDELEGNTVTGGVVYRGAAVPELYGKYVFADYIADRIFAFDPSDPFGTVQNITALLIPPAGQGAIADVVAFGEDAAGELYLVDIGGEVFKIVPEPGTAVTLAAVMLLGASRRGAGSRRTKRQDAEGPRRQG